MTEKTKQYIEQLKNECYSNNKDVVFKSRSSSLKICMVAEGNADIYPRLSCIKEWDTAAAHAIVKFAGKNIYDLKGQELKYNKEKLLNPFFIVK